ncbi:MAG: glutamine synthetase family protein [Phycisphaerales bacterium]|nr:glutamine synthetase family protein [Phycisphaerales bacterium]
MNHSPNELADRIQETGVQYVRIGWVDNGGAYRAQAVRANRMCDVEASGIGLASGVQAVPVHEDVGVASLPIGPVGQVWLVPDLQSFRQLPWEPAHAAVMGSFVTQSGSPWPYCPRSALARQLGRLDALGLAMEVAFEHEFMLLRDTEAGLEHFELSHYGSVHGLDAGGPVLDAIAGNLEMQGIPVETMLKEAGLSQFELVTTHGPPLCIADRFVAVRETIAATAMHHDLIGTCLPLVFAEEAGNGWHMHFSLWHDGENLTSDGSSLGQQSSAFLAGVLHHLPALCALTAPSTNSYRRIRPSTWSGAYRVWGHDNKEAALRVPSMRSGGPTNIELKVADASANPYLSLAGLIGAGLDGIQRHLTLPEPIACDAGRLSEEQRSVEGIELLPGTLSEALANLQQDQVLLDVLGDGLAEAYLRVKAAEASHLESKSLDDEVAALITAY